MVSLLAAALVGLALIAACALSHKVELVHADAHFEQLLAT